MIRIMDMATAAVILDPDAASGQVNQAAGRHAGMRVAGMGSVNDRLLIFLEPAEAGGHLEYLFAELEDGPSAQEVIAEVKARHYAGFRTVGFFEYGLKRWGLFARETESS